VPKENLVGPLNQGWTMAKSLLGSERIQLGSPRLAKLPLGRLRALARTLGVFDEPVFRARFDVLLLDVEDATALFVRCADALRRGRELGPEVSLLKIWMTETAQRAADLIVEIAAEAGSLDLPLALSSGGEVHAANLFFATRPMTIYGGTSEIQRNILAKAVLKLP
jgi:alkylation response protein AidB-like acyl-CoA dehydrogenase